MKLYPPWTKQEEELLLKMYPNSSINDISSALFNLSNNTRSSRAIAARLVHLGVINSRKEVHYVC
jgi:hypothetical protein